MFHKYWITWYYIVMSWFNFPSHTGDVLLGMGWGGNQDLSDIALQLIHLDLLRVRRMPAKQTETTAKVW